jgi:lipopolysaccharide assembly LptE-like protein
VRAWPLLLLLGTAGCAADPARGYAAVTTFPGGVSTVAVDIFESRTFDREIAFELADALVKEIQARTPYKVTSSAGADTILTGRIRSVERQQLSKSPLTGLSEEVALGVTIDFHWRDLRSGQTLLQVDSLTAHGLFVPSRPTAEPIEIGQFGAAQQLAREIVDELRGEW